MNDGYCVKRDFVRTIGGFIFCPSCRIEKLEDALLWYQNQHTLHFSLELLYCVDHYELSKVDESERVVWMTSGETLLECIKAASTAETEVKQDG